MLSTFLPQDDLDPAAPGASAKQMPLTGGSIGGGIDADAEAGGDPAGGPYAAEVLSRPAAVLGIVAVIAVATLAGMRYFGGDLTGAAPTPGGDAAAAKIETYLAKAAHPERLSADDVMAAGNIDAIVADTDRIVAMFAADHAATQVPLEYVQRNPFEMYQPQAAPVVVPEVDPNAAQAAHDAAARQERERRTRELKRLRDDLNNLQLNGSLGSAGAIINGEVVRTGQTVGPFTVTRIEPMSVTLEASGEQFILRIGE